MKYVVGAIVVLLLLGGGFFFYQQSLQPAQEETGTESGEIPAGAYVVMRTKDGFMPAELTIKRGETVTWKTDTNEMYWPASNLHPSHLDYAEFDPKEPVQPGQVWSFTFEKPGEWKFHDHLAPYFTGVITVTE